MFIGAILATGVSNEAINIVPGVGGVGVTTKSKCPCTQYIYK